MSVLRHVFLLFIIALAAMFTLSNTMSTTREKYDDTLELSGKIRLIYYDVFGQYPPASHLDDLLKMYNNMGDDNVFKNALLHMRSRVDTEFDEFPLVSSEDVQQDAVKAIAFYEIQNAYKVMLQRPPTDKEFKVASSLGSLEDLQKLIKASAEYKLKTGMDAQANVASALKTVAVTITDGQALLVIDEISQALGLTISDAERTFFVKLYKKYNGDKNKLQKILASVRDAKLTSTVTDIKEMTYESVPIIFDKALKDESFGSVDLASLVKDRNVFELESACKLATKPTDDSMLLISKDEINAQKKLLLQGTIKPCTGELCKPAPLIEQGGLIGYILQQ